LGTVIPPVCRTFVRLFNAPLICDGGNYKSLAGLVYGVILMLIIYVMPTGAAGFGRLLLGKLVKS
jgi:hypothetical protein